MFPRVEGFELFGIEPRRLEDAIQRLLVKTPQPYGLARLVCTSAVVLGRLFFHSAPRRIKRRIH